MARTTVLPTDPGAVKKYATEVAVEARNKSWWTPMTGTEKDALPVVRKTDLESGPGDEMTMYLIAKIVGKPVQGSEKLEGREKKLSHFTDKLLIDKHRQGVNVGDIMTQKRVPFDIAQQVKARLSDYAAEVHDEELLMHASGGRGIGSEIQNFPTTYAGFPNAFIAPDANHYMIFDGSRAAAANMLDTDKLSLAVVDAALLKAKKMLGDVEGGNAAKMQQIDVDGGKHFVMLTGPEGMYDLRRETGDSSWLALEKAKATAVGANSPIFKGGNAYYNGVLIDEQEKTVKFSGYGAGSAFYAMRSLLLGAHAVAVAYGTKGQSNNTRYQLSDSDLDHGEEDVVVMRLIAGYKKSRYNGMDFGSLTIDHAYTKAAGSTF